MSNLRSVQHGAMSNSTYLQESSPVPCENSLQLKAVQPTTNLISEADRVQTRATTTSKTAPRTEWKLDHVSNPPHRRSISLSCNRSNSIRQERRCLLLEENKVALDRAYQKVRIIFSDWYIRDRTGVYPKNLSKVFSSKLSMPDNLWEISTPALTWRFHVSWTLPSITVHEPGIWLPCSDEGWSNN